MLVTQTQIAGRLSKTLSSVRKYAMRDDFPPPVKTGAGPTGRTNLYDIADINYWKKCRDARAKRRRK
jgi:hypothetical protein